ncbi:unnamed protein product [Amoebophrya sp. A120]|nr:unnamed protein product [Amoebophrya sp. A120]|eukprot:GSA120T00005282001.1
MAQNTARLLQNQKQALKQIGAAGLKQNRMEARKKMQAKAGQMAHSSSFANAMKHNVARMVQNQQAETKATVTRQHQVENKPSFTKAVSQHFAASHAFADAAKAFARKTETEKKVEQKKVAVRTNDGDTTSHAPSSFAAKSEIANKRANADRLYLFRSCYNKNSSLPRADPIEKAAARRARSHILQ